MSLANTDFCAYHPDRPSVAVCASCERRICAECRTEEGGLTACKSCVAAIEAQVAQEGAAQAGAYVPPAAQNGPPGYAVPPVSVAPRPPLSAGNILLGTLFGGVLGVVGVAAWIAFLRVSPVDLSLIAVGVGWLIGWGVAKGCRQGGLVPAIIAGVLAFLLIGGWSGISLLARYQSGEAQAWNYIFKALCLFFGVQQAVTLAARGE